MLSSDTVRLLAEDMAATITYAMWADAGSTPDGFTAGLTTHLEAWLRNPMMVAKLEGGDQGAEYAAYLDRLANAVTRRLQGYAEVRS